MSLAGSPSYFLILLLVGFFGYANAQAKFNTPADYHAERYAAENSIMKPRSLIRDDAGDILVVSQGTGQIQAIYEDGHTVKTVPIISNITLGLNHGLTQSNGYLYASSDNAVFRWGYQGAQRTKVTVQPEVVVKNIPLNGLYQTRSLIIDRYNNLYVSVGSVANVVESEIRAQIRRFNLAEGFPADGYDYEHGEVFAKGVRNAVGFALDDKNTLWGADCGADDLYREDLGGDIHNTNPADELIRFDTSGASYGYPYCWTVYDLPNYEFGTQFAWPTFMNDSVHTDAWCQNKKDNIPPVIPLPAHNAPLGLTFYDGIGCDSQKGSFPCSMKGSLFVAFHGSVDKVNPSGYKVVRFPFFREYPDVPNYPTGEMEDVISAPDPRTCLSDPKTCFRPVDLVFNQHGHLILSSDSSNEIIRVSYNKGSSGFIVIIKKSLHVPGVVAIVIIALSTLVLVGLTVKLYGCPYCQRTGEVPYRQERI